MRPIIIKKVMKQTAEPTRCALCCTSILGGDKVFVLKTGIGTPGDILCSAECAHAAADSTEENGGVACAF